MKKGTFINCIGVGAALFTVVNVGQAQQFSGHYPSGAEGIKAATLPPAGIYLRDYNLFYTAPINKDSGLADFNVDLYVQAPRVIYMTDWLDGMGLSYGMDLLVPFYYANVKLKTPGGKMSDHTFAMGDLQFEPLLLTKHFKQFDVAGGYAFWAPTGDNNKDGTRFSRLLGKGFWGHMLTLGGTWYPTEDKSWALSILNRYEINMENKDFHVTPGNEFTLEWGVSKSVSQTIDIGVVGYYQQQTTSDSGTGASTLKDRAFAAGPEISAVIPKLGVIASLRYLREFGVKDGPEGNKATLTLTKRF
jgi:hypothetical protein